VLSNCVVIANELVIELPWLSDEIVNLRVIELRQVAGTKGARQSQPSREPKGAGVKVAQVASSFSRRVANRKDFILFF